MWLLSVIDPPGSQICNLRCLPRIVPPFSELHYTHARYNAAQDERSEEGSEYCPSSCDISGWYDNIHTHKLISWFHIHAGSSGQSLLADPEREPFHYEIQQQALHYLMPGVQSTIEEKIHGRENVRLLSA